MGELVWLRDDVVLAIHKRQLAEHGGAEEVDRSREWGSANGSGGQKTPRTCAWGSVTGGGGQCPPYGSDEKPDLAAFAASYAFAIVTNHPFTDGNKRVALVVCRTFLRLNGCGVDASQAEKYATFLKLAEGDIGEDELADWIRARLRSG